MKTSLIRTLTLSAIAIALGSSANAQTLTAKIPFDFTINGKTFPAGDYQVERGSTSTSAVFLMRDLHQNTATVTLANAAYESGLGNPRLIFTCIAGSACALSKVWGDQGSGWELPRPRVTSAQKESVAVIRVVQKAN